MDKQDYLTGIGELYAAEILVECGNLLMRAKRRFEAQWAAEHNTAAVVLDNGSMGGGHR